MDLVRFLYKSLLRITDEFPAPLDLVLDAWAFLSRTEALYGPVLADVIFYGWKGPRLVRDENFLFESPLLPTDLCSLSGAHNLSYPKFLQWERMARYLTGFLIQYQSVKVDFTRHEASSNRFLRFRDWWYSV